VSPVQLQSNTLPHPSLWGGDFSQVDPSSQPAVPDNIMASLTPTEVANNTHCVNNEDPDDPAACTNRFIQIPSRLLNPSVQSLIQTYFPKIGVGAPMDTATGRVDDFRTLLPGRSTQDLGTLRIDHDFSDSDHVYGTYNAAGQTTANTFVQTPYTG